MGGDELEAYLFNNSLNLPSPRLIANGIRARDDGKWNFMRGRFCAKHGATVSSDREPSEDKVLKAVGGGEGTTRHSMAATRLYGVLSDPLPLELWTVVADS